jgi:uncharacterized protein (DUF2141 family)
MGGRFGIPGLVSLAMVLAACASTPPPAPPTRPEGRGQVQVTVTGVTGDKGQVLVALFLDERGWPEDEDLAFGAVVLPVDGPEVVAEFADVPAGPFAISVFHDEDLDRELDTGLFGIPSEDYGFSNGARGRFGAPSFEDARLEIAAGESRTVTVSIE